MSENNYEQINTVKGRVLNFEIANNVVSLKYNQWSFIMSNTCFATMILEVFLKEMQKQIMLGLSENIQWMFQSYFYLLFIFFRHICWHILLLLFFYKISSWIFSASCKYMLTRYMCFQIIEAIILEKMFYLKSYASQFIFLCCL